MRGGGGGGGYGEWWNLREILSVDLVYGRESIYI